MNVVLAHDSLTQLGGAERVFLEMAEMFPDAPIYVLVADPRVIAQLPEAVQKRIITTKLQWLYRLYPNFQHLLPFIPFVLWLTRIPKCDVLLSSSSAFAKGFRKPKGPALSLRGGSVTKQSTVSSSEQSRLPRRSQSLTPRNDARAVHINYCHTPTRFLWTDREYIVQEVPWIVRIPARIFLWWMKGWDLRAAKKVDVFLANSKEVQMRIKQFYNRESEVVYPFVDTEVWKPTVSAELRVQSAELRGQNDVSLNTQHSRLPAPEAVGNGGQAALNTKSYFLIAGRLHAHKDNDLVVEACNELGLQLHVVGSGRDEAHLKSIAGPTITFLGRIGDEALRQEFSGARGYIYPQLEDFGLMPVEAASCGTATIGVAVGGSRETIVPGKTGEWFERGNKVDLMRVLRVWDESKYSVEELQAHASKFSKEIFKEKVVVVVNSQFPITNIQ